MRHVNTQKAIDYYIKNQQSKIQSKESKIKDVIQFSHLKNSVMQSANHNTATAASLASMPEVIRKKVTRLKKLDHTVHTGLQKGQDIVHIAAAVNESQRLMQMIVEVRDNFVSIYNKLLNMHI